MNDDVKVKVSDETPKTLIPLDGVINWDGVLKFGGRLEVDHVMHLWSWIERFITWNSI